MAGLAGGLDAGNVEEASIRNRYRHPGGQITPVVPAGAPVSGAASRALQYRISRQSSSAPSFVDLDSRFQSGWLRLTATRRVGVSRVSRPGDAPAGSCVAATLHAARSESSQASRSVVHAGSANAFWTMTTQDHGQFVAGLTIQGVLRKDAGRTGGGPPETREAPGPTTTVCLRPHVTVATRWPFRK